MLIDLRKQILKIDSIMPFGKYKGRIIEDIPPSYIQWMVKNVESYDYDSYLVFISDNYEKPTRYYEPKYYSEKEILETSKYAPHTAMDMAEEMRFNGNGVSLETWKRVCNEVQYVESGIKRGW